jgi:hypothetical protein
VVSGTEDDEILEIIVVVVAVNVMNVQLCSAAAHYAVINQQYGVSLGRVLLQYGRRWSTAG